MSEPLVGLQSCVSKIIAAYKSAVARIAHLDAEIIQLIKDIDFLHKQADADKVVIKQLTADIDDTVPGETGASMGGINA